VSTEPHDPPDPTEGATIDPRAAAAAQVEALAQANAQSNKTLRSLVEKVRDDAYMREKKVDLLEVGLKQTTRVMWLVAVVLALIFSMAIVNFNNVSAARRNAEVTANVARNAQATNELLYGCLRPDTECSRSNQDAQRKILDEIKKYELTALYCLRINPGAEDPRGDEFIACINRLYPGGPQLPDNR